MFKQYLDRIVSWMKANKIASVMIVVLAYLLMQGTHIRPLPLRTIMNKSARVDDYAISESVGYAGDAEVAMGRSLIAPAPSGGIAPRPDIVDRKVVTNSSMSMMVKDVRVAITRIKDRVADVGGYVVDTNVNTPEFGESGTIVVRVPLDSLDATLGEFRELGVKVVSENISGNDITDQYIDIEERLDRLESTKARFEEIMDQAEEVEEILKVQREILNLQNQIDSYVGQLNYFDGASSTTLVRIYLSTDELGLPYTPVKSWRPQVIFKQATRALLEDLIGVGNMAIWAVVYLPVLVVLWIAYKGFKAWIRRKQQ